VTRDRLLGSVPPMKVMFQQFEDIRHKLDDLRTGGYSITKIIELTKQPIMSNPLQLIQARRKDIIIKSQVNLLKEFKEYIHCLDEINNQALRLEGLGELDLLTKQDQFLPSYAKRHHVKK
jgi:hypothetical protein